MQIVIAGGTGFIGSALTRFFLENGHHVIVLTRQREHPGSAKNLKFFPWTAADAGEILHLVDGAQAIINLAGENIGSGIWTRSKRDLILKSRLRSARTLLDAVRRADLKPECYIQGSAIGYYGARVVRECDETSPGGSGFLAGVISELEKQVASQVPDGLRLVVLRSGIVLDSSGGYISKIRWPYHYKAGISMGCGEDWLSWISLRDEIRVIDHLLLNKGASGVFNACSPYPIHLKELHSHLNLVFRPLIHIRIPVFIMKYFPWKMGVEMLATSLKVVPTRLLETGFRFTHESFDEFARSSGIVQT